VGEQHAEQAGRPTDTCGECRPYATSG
jgi:hypothetical protein